MFNILKIYMKLITNLFLPEIKKIDQVRTFVANFQDKNEHIVNITILKHASNHEIVSKKNHKNINFNQKPCTDMNSKLRKKTKNDFEKHFLKLMNSSVFGKTMERIIKLRYIKLVATEKRRNYLVSEPNCHTKNFFSKALTAIQMKKTQTLGSSILEINI